MFYLCPLVASPSIIMTSGSKVVCFILRGLHRVTIRPDIYNTLSYVPRRQDFVMRLGLTSLASTTWRGMISVSTIPAFGI